MSEGVLVIESPAVLSHETAEGVRSCGERRLPNRDDAGLVLDMSEVRLITSIGIATMLQLQELVRSVREGGSPGEMPRGSSPTRRRRSGGDDENGDSDGSGFRLANLDEEQLAFLAMLKLDAAFDRSASVDEAVAAAER